MYTQACTQLHPYSICIINQSFIWDIMKPIKSGFNDIDCINKKMATKKTNISVALFLDLDSKLICHKPFP